MSQNNTARKVFSQKLFQILLKQRSTTFNYTNTTGLKLLRDKLVLTTSSYKQQQKREENKDFNNNTKNLFSSYKTPKRPIVNNLSIFVVVVI